MGKPSTGRAAALVTAGILLSRLFGIVRQRVAAHYLGTSAAADVISAGFRVGNITQNLLGEGTLSATFIPVYARLRGEGRPEDARRFALAALGGLILVVVAATALLVVASPWLTSLVAPGFEGERRDATIEVVRIAFPMTGVLVLSAWALGVLNAHRRFFLPYAAPVAWNLGQIGALLIAGTFLSQGPFALTKAMAWGAFAGACLQLLMLLPAARKALGALQPRVDWKNEHVREAARRMPGALVGRGVIQLSGLVDTMLVSLLGTGANATFGYAQQLYLLPMAVLGTGEAAAALPELAEDSAQASDERDKLMRERVGRSLGRVLVLALPAAVVLGIFGRELITLVLVTGSFQKASVDRVVPVLAAYSLSLVANASSRIFSATAFALGDTRTPARYATVRVAVSTVVALLLMKPFGVVGVVFGAVTAAWIELGLLTALLRREIGGVAWNLIPWRGIAAATFASGVFGGAARYLVPTMWQLGPGGALLVLLAAGLGFALAVTLTNTFDLRRILRR